MTVEFSQFFNMLRLSYRGHINSTRWLVRSTRLIPFRLVWSFVFFRQKMSENQNLTRRVRNVVRVHRLWLHVGHQGFRQIARHEEISASFTSVFSGPRLLLLRMEHGCLRRWKQLGLLHHFQFHQYYHTRHCQEQTLDNPRRRHLRILHRIQVSITGRYTAIFLVTWQEVSPRFIEGTQIGDPDLLLSDDGVKRSDENSPIADFVEGNFNESQPDPQHRQITSGPHVNRCNFASEGQIPESLQMILAATSPVFKVMFQDGTKEQQSGQVNIEDIDTNVFEEFLRFIYTGDVRHLLEIAEDLLAVADKYQVQSLKYTCIAQMLESLSADNATRMSW